MNASNNEIVGNIISANRKSGINLSGSSSNEILANKIGTDVAGTVDLGNALNGIFLTAKSNSNTIGNSNGNLISGNDNNGVQIGGRSTLNTVSNNIVGLNAAGTATLGNTLDGVRIQNASGNIIGQVDPVGGTNDFNLANVISGNGGNGIQLSAANANQIARNYIGTGRDRHRGFGERRQRNSGHGRVSEKHDRRRRQRREQPDEQRHCSAPTRQRDFGQ